MIPYFIINKSCPFCQVKFHSSKNLGSHKHLRLECRNVNCSLKVSGCNIKFLCTIDQGTQDIVQYSTAIEINDKNYLLQAGKKLFYDLDFTELSELNLLSDTFDNFNLKEDSIIIIEQFSPASCKEDFINVATRLLNLITFT